MNIFEKLKHGDPVDMMSEEYRPAVVELHRADRALFHLNHTEHHTVDGKVKTAAESEIETINDEALDHR